MGCGQSLPISVRDEIKEIERFSQTNTVVIEQCKKNNETIKTIKDENYKSYKR